VTDAGMLNAVFDDRAENPCPVEWSNLLAIPPVHVLIAEDDATIRSALAEVLTGEGFQVTTVSGAQAALQAIKRAPAQVLLTDFKLPDTDGIALLERVMQDDPSIIGIVMTGYGTIDLAVKAMKVGACDILLKPFEPDQVLLMLKRIVEMHRLRHENGVLKRAVLREGGVRLRAFELEELQQGQSRQKPGPSGTESAALQAAETGAYQRGLAEGERRARAGTGTGNDRERALLSSVIRQFEAARAAVVVQAGEQITALALAIASKVVRDHVDQHRELVVTQARDAVARVRESSLVRIHVHPDDLVRMEAERPALLRLFEGPVTIKIEEDPAISPGGCKIETPTRFVDATLEAQLGRVGEALKQRGKRGG
jgi:flagellar biosynthesis/type III secretory pathway protein FliH